jgi:anti-anti-sigma factor
LSAVSICDASGLRLMEQTHQTATAHGGWLRLAGAQPLVRRVLDITDLARVQTIYISVDDALSDQQPGR